MNDTSVVTTRDVRGVTVAFRINGTDCSLDIDIRSTLLDVLRENLQLTGTKKGCDQGTCGAHSHQAAHFGAATRYDHEPRIYSLRK